MPTTCIHPEKLRAYLATAYRLGHTDQEIVLTIGQRSDPLAALLDGHSVDCGAFITAFNPFGTQQSDALNQQAHALLAARLTGIGLQTIEGSGGEPGTDWPAERSYFALGMALADARSVGSEFGQDAIVWVGRDAIPELILLR